MIARLWVHGPLPGLNELLDAAKGAGGHGSNYSRLKRAWTETAWALARNARLPVFPGPVFFVFSWVEKERRRDPDNVAAGGRKLILDGLVKAKVIQGDGWAFVSGWRDAFSIAENPKHVGVEVTMVDATDRKTVERLAPIAHTEATR